jgi:PAS domain S-box-containing protein
LNSKDIINLIPYTRDESFTDALLTNVPACVKVLDLHATLLYLNTKGAEILELSDSEEAIGADWLGFWEGEDKLSAKRAIKSALGGEVGTFEGFYRTVQGTAKWWDVSVTALVDEFGIVQRLLVISRDITDRREKDAQLVAKNLELEVLVTRLQDKQFELDKAESMLESLLRQSHSRQDNK